MKARASENQSYIVGFAFAETAWSISNTGQTDMQLWQCVGEDYMPRSVSVMSRVHGYDIQHAVLRSITSTVM